MSLLARRLLISRVLTPKLVYMNAVAFSGTSVIANPGSIATEGQMIIFLVGGTQTVTVTAPAGFTKLTLAIGSRTSDLWYKLAGTSEPSTYTFTFSGTLGGMWRVFYVENLAFYNNTFDVLINQVASTGSGAAVPLTNAPYDIIKPCFAIATGNPGTSDTTITITDGYLPGAASHAGSYKVWYKIFDTPVTGQATTINAGGTSLGPRLTVLGGRRA